MTLESRELVQDAAVADPLHPTSSAVLDDMDSSMAYTFIPGLYQGWMPAHLDGRRHFVEPRGGAAGGGPGAVCALGVAPLGVQSDALHQQPRRPPHPPPGSPLLVRLHAVVYTLWHVARARTACSLACRQASRFRCRYAERPKRTQTEAEVHHSPPADPCIPRSAW